MLSLLWPCEMLFLICFIASWTWVVVSVMLYPCIFCVARSMDRLGLCVACLTVCVNLYLDMVVILLLNVMEVWVEVLYWIDHVWCSKLCCACDLSAHLDAPSICWVCVCRKLRPHLRAWELDHRCLLSSCCFFVWFCILCGRIRASSCYASFPLVLYSLPS